MDAAFGLAPAVGVGAEDAHRCRLDAGLLARAFLDPLDLVAVALGPANVHADQHLGPVLALGTAGAGVGLEVAVVAVGLAREQRIEARPARPRGQRAHRRDGVVDHRLVALSRAHLRELDVVGSRKPPIAESSRVRSRITACAAWGSSHSAGSSARAFSAASRSSAVSQSKTPPQQRQRLLDLVGQRRDLGTHRSLVRTSRGLREGPRRGAGSSSARCPA